MNSLKYQTKITSILPPFLDSLSSFQFGKFIIELNTDQLQSFNVSLFQFQFFGANSQTYTFNKNIKVFQYSIKTPLWNFYQYLKDMNSVQLTLQTKTPEQCLICIKKLQLFPLSKVINQNYLKGNYIANSVQLCDIFSQSTKQNKGYIMFKVKLQFDESIHNEIKNIFDFQKLLNQSHAINENEKFVPLLKQAKEKSIQVKEVNQNINEYLGHNSFLDQSSAFKNSQEEESKIIEDDIERLIAEMQSKPYDSKKYLDDPANSTKNGFQFRKLNQNQSMNSLNNFKPNQQMYPSKPILNNRNTNINYQFIDNQTVLRGNQRSLSPINARNHSLNKIHHISPHYQSLRNISYNQSSLLINEQKISIGQPGKGTLKLQIHQLLGRDLEISDYILRVFVNNQGQDIINCKGFQQGEVIIYNQKVELNQCQLCNIQMLRFQLENWDGQIVYSAIFQMERLIKIPKLQGVFMVNFHSHQQEFYGNQVLASTGILKKLQKPPNQKSLRITLAFSQQIEVIQLYLNLGKFSLSFSKCKYKIPFTKQTVEFQYTQSHINIFPHSKIFTKLMLQFWDDKAIVGLSQINLSNLKNITKNLLDCNLEPIYLYDSLFSIKNISTQNQIGTFKLLMCCGNVRQIQHILNRNIQKASSLTQSFSSNQPKALIEVQYDKKLGVFVKDRKIQQQIEIQVDISDLPKDNINQKQTLRNQNNKQHEISIICQNQFLCNRSFDHGLNEMFISQVHATKLNQQEELEDDEQHEENQIHIFKNPIFQAKDSKPSSISTERKNSSTIQSLNLLNKKPLPLEAKSLQSVESVICNHIKSSFAFLSENKFQNFLDLKKSCKSHLLFNFIDIDVLIKHMMDLGMNKVNITRILEILQPLNGMANFNMLNDFIMSLQVEGEIKYSLVPNKLFIKLTLEEYYKRSCLEIQRQEQDFDGKAKADDMQWLTKKYLSQIQTLDQSIDFNEIKKLFSQLSMKISMNQYSLIKNFLDNEKQIKNFLFELAESQTAYQSIIKSQANLFDLLKLTIIQDLISKRKQQQMNHKYQQSILDKLYSSKMQTSNYSESNIINRSGRIVPQLKVNHELTQTVRHYPAKKEQSNPTSYQFPSFAKNSNRQSQKPLQNQDEEDFIINGLNSKAKGSLSLEKQPVESSFFIEERSAKVQSKQSRNIYEQKQGSQFQQSSLVSTHRFKQQFQLYQFVKTGETVMNYKKKRSITLSGLEDCKVTCECQLQIELASPYIKVTIENPINQKLYFKHSDTSSCQSFQMDFDSNQSDQFEGVVTLHDITSKGQIQISAARFVAIIGLQSVYALKTIKNQEFSGLVKIIIQ